MSHKIKDQRRDGWLKEQLDSCSAEVASWPEYMRERPLCSFDDTAIKRALTLSLDKLNELMNEAIKRKII